MTWSIRHPARKEERKDEEDIRSERFKCSGASKISYKRNTIGLELAYASAM